MEIFDIQSPSGRESEMAEYIKQYGEKCGYSCRIDDFGNLICEKGTSSSALECGMDSLAIMATAYNDDGMIKVAVPNGNMAEKIVGMKIKFLNGTVGIVRCEKSEKVTDFDLCVDVGAMNKDEAEKTVPVGEFASPLCEKFENGRYIIGNGLSSYVPIYALLQIMKSVNNTAFLFSAQKKFAGRGLCALYEKVNYDFVISVNTVPEKNGVKCGKGVVVPIKERNVVPSVNLCRDIIDKRENVQVCGTEEALWLDKAMLYGKGSHCIGVCLAVRDKNKAYEAVAKSDIEALCGMITDYLKRGV